MQSEADAPDTTDTSDSPDTPESPGIPESRPASGMDEDNTRDTKKMERPPQERMAPLPEFSRVHEYLVWIYLILVALFSIELFLLPTPLGSFFSVFKLICLCTMFFLLFGAAFILYRHFVMPARRMVAYILARHRRRNVPTDALARVPPEWRPWINALAMIFDRMETMEKKVAEAQAGRKLEKNLLHRFSWVFEKNETLAKEIQVKNRALEHEVEKHKRTATELKRHRDHLDELVHERTADVLKANRRLKTAIETARQMAADAEAANRAKSQFLANVSHEVRTPLNAVIGFTDMLIDTPMNESQLDFARTIRNSGESLLTLINDILDFSKIESGELKLEAIDFSPELLAYDVSEMVRPRIGDKPIELICRIDPKIPPYLLGDPVRFQQVLTNLMGNAPKFTEAGEIILAISIEEEEDDRIKIHAMIQDTGIGIPEDKLAVIFEPFHQADGSTTRKYGGTGLGLSISRRLATLMGGDIRVESEVDVGSTFHFTAWLGKSEKKEDWQSVAARLAGKQVLIVDDNPASLSILANALESAGIRVSDLGSGMEVVPTLERAIIAEHPFDCAIIDIHMPGMSGYEVAKEVRSSDKPVIAKLPLIAVSYMAERDPILFTQAGFGQSIVKPIRRERLFNILAQVTGEGGIPAKGASKKAKAKPKDYIGAKILVAEDNAVNQKLIKMMLAKLGCEVVMTENGREAVDTFSAKPDEFALIFMDIQMPEMDGFAALREIRGQGYADIPVVALTAHAMAEHKEECLRAGMNDYLSKPIRKAALVKVLDRFLN
ncbi:MAG: response regulator [Deltaproteobacteria bacterium]|nr:response regulator [Deltaproteobacteria bacterium]